MIIRPKWIGSTPSSIAIGRKIGVKMRIAGVGSMKAPTISRISIISSRITVFESARPSSAEEIDCGIIA